MIIYIFFSKEEPFSVINYNNFENAFIASSLLFLNEEWNLIMYTYMRKVGNWTAIYFTIIVFFGSVLMTKMFAVLFINSILDSPNLKKLLHINNVFTDFSDFVKSKFNKRNSINASSIISANKHKVIFK